MWFLSENVGVKFMLECKITGCCVTSGFYAQNYRNTELQNYRNTELQKYRIKDLQNYRITEIQNYRGPAVLYCAVSEVHCGCYLLCLKIGLSWHKLLLNILNLVRTQPEQPGGEN